MEAICDKSCKEFNVNKCCLTKFQNLLISDERKCLLKVILVIVSVEKVEFRFPAEVEPFTLVKNILDNPLKRNNPRVKGFDELKQKTGVRVMQLLFAVDKGSGT